MIKLGDIVETPEGRGVVMVVLNCCDRSKTSTGYYVDLFGGAGGGYHYMLVPHLAKHPMWDSDFVPDSNLYTLNFFLHDQVRKVE